MAAAESSSAMAIGGAGSRSPLLSASSAPDICHSSWIAAKATMRGASGGGGRRGEPVAEAARRRAGGGSIGAVVIAYRGRRQRRQGGEPVTVPSALSLSLVLAGSGGGREGSQHRRRHGRRGRRQGGEPAEDEWWPWCFRDL